MSDNDEDDEDDEDGGVDCCLHSQGGVSYLGLYCCKIYTNRPPEAAVNLCCSSFTVKLNNKRFEPAEVELEPPPVLKSFIFSMRFGVICDPHGPQTEPMDPELEDISVSVHLSLESPKLTSAP